MRSGPDGSRRTEPPPGHDDRRHRDEGPASLGRATWGERSLLEPLCILWVLYSIRTGSWNHAYKMLHK